MDGWKNAERLCMRMDGGTNGWTEGCGKVVYEGGWMGGWMDGWMDRWMDQWKDAERLRMRMDGCE
jgi:hypothetical protein